MYKLTNGQMVQRIADGALIPNDQKNADWNDYQRWVKAGGIAERADAAPEPAIDKRRAAIEALLIEQSERADAPKAVKDYVNK